MYRTDDLPKAYFANGITTPRELLIYGCASSPQQLRLKRHGLASSVQQKPAPHSLFPAAIQLQEGDNSASGRKASPHHHSSTLSRPNQEPIDENASGFAPSSEDIVQSLCRQGNLDKALLALFGMPSAPASTSCYLSLLSLCIKSKSIVHVKQVYAHIASHKVSLKGMLGDYLVMALARCGALEDARQVSTSLPHLTVFSWSAIISAYSEQGCGLEALKVYHFMLDQGIDPDKYTFVGLFRACGSINDLNEGRKLHIEACMRGHTLNLFVSNSLITMYGKHGAILEAENLFQGMSYRDVVSWNALFSAYVEQDMEEKALKSYRQMQEEGLHPNQQTFVIVLQACIIFAEKEEALFVEGTVIKIKALKIGEALHADARSKGLEVDLYVGTTLVTMYGKCGAIAEAENLFSALPQRSIISWNSMLSAFVDQRQGAKALRFYKNLLQEGVVLDELTAVFALQACGILAENEASVDGTLKERSLQIGRALHTDLWTRGFKSNVFIGTALIGMYSKFKAIFDAENVFRELQEWNLVTWSAMIAAYMDQGLGQKALRLYAQMQEEGFSPNLQLVVLAIQACGALADNGEAYSEENFEEKLSSLELGHALHMDACKRGLTSGLPIGTALVSMYGKCGSIMESEGIFRVLMQPDAMTYTAMLSAYVGEGYAVEALGLYKERQQHLVLDDVMLICLLQACGETGILEVCEELYFVIVAAGYDRVTSVIAALVQTYGNCARMIDGQEAFTGLCEPDLISWTACIMGHAGEGNVAESLHMLDQVKLTGLRLDETALVSALVACDHTGNIAKAFELFTCISRDYGIVPQIKHYGVMVELLGRAGDFQRIQDLLDWMPIEADVTMWLCILGACCAHGHFALAKEAFTQTLNLQPNQAYGYTLMSNVYVDFVH